MKYILLLAIVGSGAMAKKHRRHSVKNLVQQRAEGVDPKDLHPDRHWMLPWPQGIDDGTDDDNIILPEKKEKSPDKPLKFIIKGREWTPGTWPVHHTWDKDWESATQHKIIDDGTDDDEVLNVQQAADMLY